jgi:A/G-specific adenine glycosylase
MQPRRFALIVNDWADELTRDLPWKKDKNPYKIWISEIILQQTRVAQGIPYYLRFIARFPDVKSLASASVEDVIKAWEGLGYYSRARNIHAAARQVMEEHGGKFPREYAMILSLKGIGPYTAAAISSFAYGYAYAAIDGNAMRVIARLQGLEESMSSPSLALKCTQFLTQTLKHIDAAKLNQAVMDIGAQICLPKSPKCEQCRLSSYCTAYTQDITHMLPVPKAKIKQRKRYFHYLVIRDAQDHIVVEQRSEGDIWAKMYQFPLIESDSDQIPKLEALQKLYPSIKTKDISAITTIKQKLTHQEIIAIFYSVNLSARPKINKDQNLVKLKKVSIFAYPKVMNQFINKWL